MLVKPAVVSASLNSVWVRAPAMHPVHACMSALVAFAKRQTGVERLEWLKSRQEDLVIESLKQWLHRSQAVA